MAAFLHEHLEEYGDEETAIQKAVDYVFQLGGRVVIAKDDDRIMGAVVINATGMSDYAFSCISQCDYRGIGKSLKDST